MQKLTSLPAHARAPTRATRTSKAGAAVSHAVVKSVCQASTLAVFGVRGRCH